MGTAGQDPATVERLLRSLPEWFGIESSVAEYVEAARRLQTVLAWPGGGDGLTTPIGVLLLERHFPVSAEIHVMAVDRAWHRRGVGTALVGEAERVLREQGVLLLGVKTLGPSDPDPGYAATRRFYEAVGFLPVEELRGVWPDDPCLVMVKPLG
ncbi:MAG: GNAT family N-acetyltransferase [Actinomycetales bacterium]|nr:GNAT family N-acetyltransferase [Actinomycetales bacterium]